MAIEITPITETKIVNKLQITGFRIDYENMEMTSEYMTFLDNGEPYQRGRVSTNDETEIATLMGEVQAKVLAGQSIDEASSEVAYNFVIARL